MHVLVKQRIVMIDVERLVPVLVDMVSPIECPLHDPTAILPTHDRGFPRNDIVLEQAPVKAVTFVVGDEIRIRIRARGQTPEDGTLGVCRAFRCLGL